MNHDVRAKQIANDLRAGWAQSQQVRSQQVEGRNGAPHRGVIALGEAGLCAVFARDNYRLDPRTRAEVARLFRDAYERDIEVLGFAIDDTDGACWAMIVACDQSEWLEARLHEAFLCSHGFDKLQPLPA